MSEHSTGRPTAAATDDPSAEADTGEQERAPNTLLNALIGGLAAVVLSFVPFSTVLGGGLAGYLEGGDAAAGAKVGAIAGLVAFVPFLFIIGLLLLVVPVMPMPGAGVQFALWVSILFIVLLGAVYTVGLSMLGGVLGVYVKEET